MSNGKRHIQQQNMIHEESIRFVYIRALEHVAERIDAFRGDMRSATTTQFIKQDLIKYDWHNNR
jgi:hypothetical protein